MQREILFRGKRVDNGEWVEGYYYFNEGDSTHRVIVSCATMQYGYIVIPESVGQFTGLKDRNQNKCFEGDFVKWGNHIYTIKYYPESAGFVMYRLNEEGEDVMICADSDAMSGAEIIGNVTDNSVPCKTP